MVRLSHDEARERVQDTAPALAWVERVPRVIDGERVQQRQESGDRGAEVPVERQDLVRHLRRHLRRRVAVVQFEVRSEELDDRRPTGALLVRERARLQDAPLLRELRGDELVNEAGLAHAGLGRDRRELAAPLRSLAEDPLEPLELCLPPDEQGEPLGAGGSDDRPRARRAYELVHLQRCVESLDRPRAERLDGDAGLREPERPLADQDRSWRGHLFHPCRQVGRLTNGGVVHVEVVPDRAHDHLARVDAHADPDDDPFGALELFRVAAHRCLHAERGVARAYGVILMGDRRPEERHDPVTHDLIHDALVAVDRFQHALEDSVQQPARLLGVAVGQELHGALEVGEEYRDLLALANEGGSGR